MILVENPQQKKPLWEWKHANEDNLKIDLKEIWWDNMNFIKLFRMYGLITRFCEAGDEPMSLKTKSVHLPSK
jgi:hypothetical protein